MTADTFSSLLNSDQVTEPTRKVLKQRLYGVAVTPVFFTSDEFALLQAVCDCLLAQQPANRLVDIAGAIDRRLNEKKGIGWRYKPASG